MIRQGMAIMLLILISQEYSLSLYLWPIQKSRLHEAHLSFVEIMQSTLRLHCERTINLLAPAC